jgi:hypothetical protein
MRFVSDLVAADTSGFPRQTPLEVKRKTEGKVAGKRVEVGRNVLDGHQAAAGRFSSQVGRTMIVVAMGCLLLFATFAGIAFGGAADADQDVPVPLVSPSVDSIQDLNALTSEGEVVSEVPATDPTAAEALPHTDLDRGEAQDLLVSVFPTATEDPGGIYNEFEPKAFHSDYVAVIPSEGSGEPAGLLTSVLPLRTQGDGGEKEAVDLTLEAGPQGNLEPANPLVEVKIPATAGGEIKLAEAEVGVELATPQAEPSASTIEGTAAFYPNVADDSDFLVVPAATGFETFTQLRSPTAPATQRFNLSLPQGATVEATDDGGAAVVKGGEPLVALKPPTALDAEGNAVPVSLSADDASIELHTETSPETAYPVLVDPLWDNYSWKDTGSNVGLGTDWRGYETPNQSSFHWSSIGNLNTILYYGLALRSYPGSISPGTSTNWNYYVPRYFSDYAAVGKRPTSFIRNMNLSQVYYVIEENPSAGQPYIIAGIWDEATGTFHSSTTHDAHEGAWNGATLNFPNSQENTNVRNGGIALASYNDVAFKRQVFVGQASVEVSDKDLPTWGYMLNPGWTNNLSANAPLDYAVSDSGLGIYSFKLTRPQATGGSGVVAISNECVGNASKPCPVTAETANRAVPYDPANVAQGISTMSVTAQDPVGNQSAPKLVQIRVDHDAPTVSVSGNATEQSTVGTKLPTYAVNYAAKDGDDATAAASTPVGTAGTAAGQLERPMGIASDASGNTWVADTTNNRVVEYDKNGTYLRQLTGSPEAGFGEPRGVAIAPNGNIWVSEKGARRFQQFTPSGQFVSKFSNTNVEPYDIAFDAAGNLWVTDSSAKKVYKLTQSGTPSKTISIPQPVGGSAIPFGLDIDEFGNPWVAIQGTNKIMEINPNSSSSPGDAVSFSFGSEGTEPGQFKSPADVAIAPSGNVLMTDGVRNRVQVFRPDGTFMRQYSSTGTLNSQFTEPRGLDVALENKLVVADAGNKRVARWTHADQDPQSGATKVEVKVDGQVTHINAAPCPDKNCLINGSWTLNVDNYTVGVHKVEVLATDGVNTTSAPKTFNVETHGDRTAPTASLSGSLTEQATLGKTLPTYKLKVAASDPGPAEERQSGVASITIMVDGKVVDSVAPGCPSGGCSLSRDWTLTSNNFTAGWHWLEVISTDAAGKEKNTFREFEIKRDTTAPELALSGAIGEAPSGWVQEGTRSLIADATDVGGYGVKQIRVQIDGQLVGESLTQTCEMGGCPKSKTFWIDMTPFGGGAHEGVVAAEDLAGNIRKRIWTINIDPLGHISFGEAADTVEAAEVTAPETVSLSSAPGVITNSSDETSGGEPPTVVYAEGEYRSDGASAESTFGTAPASAFTVETTGHTEAGSSVSTTVEVEPLGVATTATSPTVVNEAAVVTANSGTEVDMISRPIFDGLMTFQDIRDITAPGTYAWRVKLGYGEELKSIDSRHAGVFWADGTQAMLISAQVAHDAHGQVVPTTLAVSNGNVITLTVHHKDQSYVYPVMAGAGWQGGFITEAAEVTDPESSEDKYLEGMSSHLWVGPPEVAPSNDPESVDPDAATASANYNGLIRRWAEDACAPFGACGVWKNHFKGFFYFNYKKAWYPKNRDPQCEPFAAVNWSIDITECKWVGPNYQWYGDGYHITARTQWDVTVDYAVTSKTSSKAVVGRAFGSGNIYFHATSDICNPSRPDCG